MGRNTEKPVTLADVYRILRRDDVSFVICHLRGVSGWWHPDGTIEIDPRSELLLVLLHECVHELRPNWSEKACDDAAKKILCKMTQRQIGNLLRKFASRI